MWPFVFDNLIDEVTDCFLVLIKMTFFIRRKMTFFITRQRVCVRDKAPILNIFIASGSGPLL